MDTSPSRPQLRLVRLFLGALLFTSLPLGCGTSSDHPDQLDPIQSGSGATSGASTSTGGAPIQVCECIAAVDATPACGQCTIDSVFFGSKPCDDEALLCNQDPGCSAMVACLGNCHSPCCIDACIVGQTGADALSNFQALYTCSCSACATECAYPDEIECVADGEQGAGGDSACGDGGGGSGGSGGGA